MIRRRALTGSVAFVLVSALPAPAQELVEQPGRDIAEEDGAVYARVRYLEGPLSLRRGEEILSDIVANDPLAPGDVVSTGPGGRAEIQLADGSLLKLDLGTEVVLQAMADGSQIENTTIVQLGAGSIILRADEMDSNEKRFQVDTDAATVFLLSNGQFRIDARADGATVVSSRRGVAEVMAQEISTMVRSGERVIVRASQIPGEPQVFNTRQNDGFDVWASQRDDALVRQARPDEEAPAGLPEPVQPYASELSYYGNWYNNPSYGWVWRPVGLAVDWQPYWNGRWAYTPAGLVWVSYDPWGWAPFHYGRWEFLVGSGWVWIPGHVFSGAYVAWGLAPGYFGWCPLGYYDYPVSFHFGVGYRRDPWVYVRGHQLFDRRLATVGIRDATLIRNIESRRIIVRGAPRVEPGKLRVAGRRMTEDFYSTFASRRDLQVSASEEKRRMPFHEGERQRLVKLNSRRVQAERASPGQTPPKGVRQVNGRSVPVSRGQLIAPSRTSPDATSRRSVSVPRRGPSSGNPPSPAASRAPNRPATPPASEPKVVPDDRKAPERVLPRIIPRLRPLDAGPGTEPVPSGRPSRAESGRSRPATQDGAPKPQVRNGGSGRPAQAGERSSVQAKKKPKPQQREKPQERSDGEDHHKKKD